MKSYSKPTNEQVDAAMPLLSSPQHEAYFFSRLENPLWISPLAERGAFKHPPRAVTVQGGGIRFPTWPVSQYLARMATIAPREVAEVMVHVETDNPSIIGDIVHAARVMPIDVASSIIQPICQAAQGGTLWIHYNDACALCVRLAESDEVDAAFELAKALFALNFKEGEEEPHRHDAYWYKEGLRNVAPALAVRTPREFLPQLCNWLSASVQSQRGVDRETGYDYSFIWRPAIEEHSQNHDYDFAGEMVGLVREGFELAINNHCLVLNDALQLLDEYRYLIFKRIRLHLIGEFADQNPDLARATILKRELFDDHKYIHEYAMLVGRRLDLLSTEDRAEWFAWIDAGPDLSNFNESIRRNLDRDVTEEDRQDRINDWKFCKLHWVRTHLKGERREFYERMLAENGEPKLADLNCRTNSGRSGDESPMNVEELAEMGFTQAVDTVASWPANSNTRGLASTFKQYIATDPVMYSEQACALIGRPAIFVRGFINQMSEAVKADQHIHLEPVLELCEWVLQRPVGERTTGAHEDKPLVDKDWQWTRDAISGFIENVCKARDGDSPRYSMDTFRRRLWKLLDSLCRDCAVSSIVRDVTKEDCRIHDYLHLGINSARGKAVEAALEYARWVANHVRQKEDKREVIPGGFNVIPEVREMLEWQIAPGNRTVEAMAIIGSRISLIYWIDRDWLAENTNRLFRLEEFQSSADGSCGWAAWNAFLVWGWPHIEYYRCFRSQFAFAIEQLGKVELTNSSREQPMEHLGQHMLLLYGRGQLDAEEDNQRLWQFLESAHPAIRTHSIAFVGHVLGGNEDIPAEVIARFETLWDQYWDRLGKRDAEERPDEWLFGPWFICGKFADQWALERLEAFVETNPNVQPDHSVAERLDAIAPIDVTISIRILNRILRNDSEGWRVYSWKDVAKRILKLAMKTPGEARDTAEKLIDYLGRRGYTEFGQLLGEE